MSDAPLIEIRQVTKRFPGVVALKDVSFDVRRGEFHSICGENGAGKSTLMKILSGVYADYEGAILVNGQTVQFQGTRDAEEKGVSIIHQELNLVEELTVAANIFLGREMTGSWGLLNDRQMEVEADGLFAQLDSKISPRQLVRELRVGDQQLVEIAKALSRKAEILIMDEPTSALTETEVERLFRVIQKLRASGVTILYISHKMEVSVPALGPDHGDARRAGREDSRPHDDQPREITHLMVGREIENTDLSAGRKFGETILEVRSLSLPRYGHARKWRLENISLELKRGEVLGIAGLMGAGRTELLECLFGASSIAPQGRSC